MPNELKPCPVCGKKPKIHYYGINTAWVQCKPFLREPHCVVLVRYANPSQLKNAVINAWNRGVNNG